MSTDNEKTIVELNGMDAALIFREGGGMELLFPDGDPEAIISTGVQLAAAFAQAVATNSPIVQMLLGELEDRIHANVETGGVGESEANRQG